MVMWFNVPEAREYLLQYGEVYTLRPKKRREGKEVLSYGGFGKKGEVNVKFVKEILDWNELNRYVDKSGFRTVDEWVRKAKGNRFLYHVVLLSKTTSSFIE
jgi:hypothetical protein